MSYDVYWVKNRAEKIADFEHPTSGGSLGEGRQTEGISERRFSCFSFS